MKTTDAPLMNTYGRTGITFVRGEGVKLFDHNGKEYLDFLAGLAVVSAGHANPEIAAALTEQAQKLVHVSNLFWTEPMAELAYRLHDITGGGKVFFANSGAEANECAIKLARKWAGAGRYKIVCAESSFHGRTLASLAATGQPAKWSGFEPLPDGFSHCPFNDLEAFEAAVDDATAAIWVEPILGEGGVIPAEKDFLQGLRALCDRKKIALIFDEVQCGLGRTGSWWAFQHFGVKPDLFTSAKALANGLPIGACIALDEFGEVFSPGEHATTYGGGPVICAAALATLKVLERVLPDVSAKGELLRQKLKGMPGAARVRGCGLMNALVLEKEISGEIVKTCLERGLVLNAVRPNAIRLTPPLTVSSEEIHQACTLLETVLRESFSD